MSEYAVVNPATGEQVLSYPAISDHELDAAVAKADAAHQGWSRATATEERAALVRRVGQLHTERRERLAEILVREMGKPLEQALGEVDFCAAIYAYYADHADSIMADEDIALMDGEGSALIRRNSVGPLLGIMPWNYPFYQVSRFAGPNLVVGNTILLKPAPQCPESATAIEDIFRAAGFPAGAFRSIFATNEQVAAVIGDARVRGVSVTGSERAGAAVAEIAGRNLKKVVLELGGSDPFILLSTDDLDQTVHAAVAARVENTGQACNAAKRFVIIDELYDAFLEKFSAALKAVKSGDPTAPDSAMGPLSSTTAADRLEEQIRRAVDQGATMVVGGEREGNFFPAYVLTDIDPENTAHHEEFFGPVALVYRAASEAAAVEIANDTPFGLGAYVFSTDAQQALRVADQIDAGMVWINVVGADSPELPFGGVKRSGFGRELGRLGAEEFVNKKMIRISA